MWNVGDVVLVNDNDEMVREAKIIGFDNDDDGVFVVEVLFDDGETAYFYEEDVSVK